MTAESDQSIETFMQRAALKLLRLTDEQEARGWELDQLHDFERARRVRLCGNERFGLINKTCKQRACPRCARAHAAANARKIEQATRAMSSPKAVLLTLRSRGRGDLSSTIDHFRRSVAKLWRMDCSLKIRALVGALETAMTQDGKAFLVHAHLAADADALDVDALTRAWSRLTATGSGNSVGTFGTDGPIRSASAFSKYATKSTTWSPAPGEVDLESLARVLDAIAGRKLVIIFDRAKRRRAVVVRHLRDEFEERAGVYEFDANLDRESAERLAARWAQREWMTRLAARRRSLS